MQKLFLGTLLILSTSTATWAQGAAAGEKETGLAAVYSSALNHHRTASGQIYDASKLTAAHKTLPYGTKIKVTNPKNHKSVMVRVNNRGPVQSGRILDLSSAAASRLGIGKKQMREVNLEVVSVGNGPHHHAH